jgi:hypothetical protein
VVLYRNDGANLQTLILKTIGPLKKSVIFSTLPAGEEAFVSLPAQYQ